MSKSASAGSVGRSPKKAAASGVETGGENGGEKVEEENTRSPVMSEKGGSVDGELPRPSSSSSNCKLAPSQSRHRPPIRPAIPSISKSKFELEPNPFEQSFSRTSKSIHTRVQSQSSSEDVSGPNLEGVVAKHERTSPSGDGPPTALPPLSALASPATDPANHFSWSGLSSSLRAGLLSPAVLTGPASHATHVTSEFSHGTGLTPQLAGGYDSAMVWTGFTPGSGFTPNFGGACGGPSSFPMPSPNTAAFLSMVTNSLPQGPEAVASAAAAANGQQAAGGQQPNGNSQQPPNGVNPIESTITYLSALSGVINSMNAANGRQSEYSQNGPHQQGYGQQPRTPQQQPHIQQPDLYLPQQQHHGHRPSSPGRQGYVQHMANGGHLPPHMLQSMGPQGHLQSMQFGQPITMPPSHLHGGEQGSYPQRANVASSQAANGLFLLSQAHQELSKREEEMKVDAPRPKKGKRKSEDGKKAGQPAAANKKAKKESQAAPVPAAPVVHNTSINGEGTSVSSGTSPEYMDDDEADPDSKLLEMAGYHQSGRQGSLAPSKVGSHQGRPETEEERRKNFLERNRHAALKCRRRKKAWLEQLQTKVDSLTTGNYRLKNIVQNLTDEVARMSAVLVSHRDCPGMSGSLAQIGLNTIPGPLPPGAPLHCHHGETA